MTIGELQRRLQGMLETHPGVITESTPVFIDMGMRRNRIQERADAQPGQVVRFLDPARNVIFGGEVVTTEEANDDAELKVVNAVVIFGGE